VKKRFYPKEVSPPTGSIPTFVDELQVAITEEAQLPDKKLECVQGLIVKIYLRF
jgi:hypothetical protein